MENQLELNDVEQQKPEHPELTITDLQNLKSIVEVAVRRGVFAASEISSVGTVYDKVNAFLNAVSSKNEQK